MKPQVNLQEKMENPPTVYETNGKNCHNKKWLGVVYIIASAFCFALMGLFVRLSGDLPVFQKSFFRNIVSAVFAFVLLLKSGSLKMQKGSLPGLLARSIAGTLGICCNFYAIDTMDIADASMLNKLAPFFTVIFSSLLLKEKASFADWLLIIVAFFGATLVVKPSFNFQESLPAIIGVIGGLTAGLAYTFIHHLGKKGERSVFIVFFFSTFSSLTMLPFMLTTYQPMEWSQLGFLLLAGLAASGGQFSITAAYSCAAAKEISVYDYSQILFSALLGMIFLSEFPDWVSVVGYFVIIGAAVAKYVFENVKHKKTIQNDKRPSR